ncbi:MAG: hypothetical protein GY830_04845 [Bacteroidetes bacterium]|nr:hypothetical protein [Bacteroidota bacterium]
MSFYKNEIIKEAKKLLIPNHIEVYIKNNEQPKIIKALSFDNEYHTTYLYDIFNTNYEISKILIQRMKKNELSHYTDTGSIICDFIKDIYHTFSIKYFDDLVIFNESNLMILDFFLKQFPLTKIQFNEIIYLIDQSDNEYYLGSKLHSNTIIYLRDSIEQVLAKYMDKNLYFIPGFKNRNCFFSKNNLHFLYKEYIKANLHFIVPSLGLLFFTSSIYLFIKILMYLEGIE